MNYVFDLDGTLCTNTDGKYDLAFPIIERIRHVNYLYDCGNKITIYTARGMSTYNGNVKKVYDTYYEKTKKQLENWKIKYHYLILGKPAGDVYVDDKGIKDEDYFRTSFST